MSNNAVQLTAAMESAQAVEGTEFMVRDLGLPNAATIAPMPTYAVPVSRNLPEATSIAAVKGDEISYNDMLMKITSSSTGETA